MPKAAWSLVAPVLIICLAYATCVCAEVPHCCAPASFSFLTETFTNIKDVPYKAAIGTNYYDENRGVFSSAYYGNVTYHTYALKDALYIVNVSDHYNCITVRCQGDTPCFSPYCTNSTSWLYNGIVTVGTEKASQWSSSVRGTDSFILQIVPTDKTRCIPIALTAASGQTENTLEYYFSRWSNVKSMTIPPSLFIPPSNCRRARAYHAADLLQDHPELQAILRALKLPRA